MLPLACMRKQWRQEGLKVSQCPRRCSVVWGRHGYQNQTAFALPFLIQLVSSQIIILSEEFLYLQEVHALFQCYWNTGGAVSEGGGTEDGVVAEKDESYHSDLAKNLLHFSSLVI